MGACRAMATRRNRAAQTELVRRLLVARLYEGLHELGRLGEDAGHLLVGPLLLAVQGVEHLDCVGRYTGSATGTPSAAAAPSRRRGEVIGDGSVPPWTGSPSACSSFLPRIRLYPVTARAAPVRAAFAPVDAPTPCCAATRSRFAYRIPTPPIRCAAIAARLTGVHRAHAAVATRSRSYGVGHIGSGSVEADSAGQRSTNQAARPRSCRLRMTVLRSDTGSTPRIRLGPQLRPVPRRTPRAADHVAVGCRLARPDRTGERLADPPPAAGNDSPHHAAGASRSPSPRSTGSGRDSTATGSRGSRRYTWSPTPPGYFVHYVEPTLVGQVTAAVVDATRAANPSASPPPMSPLEQQAEARGVLGAAPLGHQHAAASTSATSCVALTSRAAPDPHSLPPPAPTGGVVDTSMSSSRRGCAPPQMTKAQWPAVALWSGGAVSSSRPR